MRTSALGLVFTVLLLGAPGASASPDRVIEYQGRLTDSNGVPREGQVPRIAFRLYSAPTPSAGTFVWGEVHVDVPVRRGVFSVLLGNGNAALDAADNETTGANPFVEEFADGAARYLEVEVEGTRLSPLHRLGHVPFAVNAGGSVPIGGVIDWYRPSVNTPVPDGWVICDGRTITDPASPFDGLSAPDLVGKFVRGLDPAHVVNGSRFGADAPTDSERLPESGGSASATIDIPVPPHRHDVNLETSTPQFVMLSAARGVYQFVVGAVDHNHTVVGQTSDSSTTTQTVTRTVPTTPPYVGLLKIMRVR